MERGADIHIIEQRPKELVDEEKKDLKKRREELNLREQASFLDVIHGTSGKKLAGLIAQQLEKRIDDFLRNDPEASAYAKMLKELGYKEKLAKRAIKLLFERELGRADTPSE